MAHAADQVLRPRHQFARVYRLADVVVGAAFEADDAVDVVVAPGDEDDADLRAHAQLAGQGQAVLAGQADVEQHQVDRLLAALGLGQAAFRLLGGVGAEHVVAFLGEVGLEEFANQRIVIDDQYTGSHRTALECLLIVGCRKRPTAAAG
ncbi:hypothetical protein D9M71_671850 [compost metagenome]